MTHRVYFPVESLVGLGHFNRAGKIVRTMVEAGFDMAVASSTFVNPMRFFAGARHLPIPGYVINKSHGNGVTLHNDGRITPVHDFDPQLWQETRAKAHVKHIQAIRPDIFFSEFWPFDRRVLDYEMTAALESLKASAALRCVSVRDILNQPDEKGVGAKAAPSEDREASALAALNEHFDAVLVHGDPAFVPLQETFGLVDRIKPEIIYTGYVIDDLPSRKTEPNAKPAPLLVSCGSGVDGDEMMYAFLTAWQKLLKDAPSDEQIRYVTERPLHIVTGPRFNDIHYGMVERWVEKLVKEKGQEIQLEKYRSDYASLLSTCAFSISLAGYNTTLETLAMNVPSLFIPKYIFKRGKVHVASEQLYRLTRLQQKDYASFAHPDDVQCADKFASLIVREFVKQTTSSRRRPCLNFSGAAQTLSAVQELAALRCSRQLKA